MLECICWIIQIKTDFPEDKKCLNHSITSWSSLKTLKIKKLEPNSEYQILIIPFNRYKRSERTMLSIKTKKEGKIVVIKCGHQLTRVDYFQILMPCTIWMQYWIQGLRGICILISKSRPKLVAEYWSIT